MEKQISLFDDMKTKKDETKRIGEIECAHCFFEQSGTFKNEFRKLGIDAYDYDILDDFGETDYVIDLYSEIENAYEEKESIFDNISKNDLIIAFFPCVRFENQIMLSFRGQAKQLKNWSTEEKILYDMKLMDELKRNYDVVSKLFLVCMKKGIKLILENPYSQEHFLRRYWCCPPSIIDKDRRDNGDYYAKPTQYWFVNFEPNNNNLYENVTDNSMQLKDAIRSINGKHYKKMGAKNQRVARSMIHPDYANRFIRQYIL